MIMNAHTYRYTAPEQPLPISHLETSIGHGDHWAILIERESDLRDYLNQAMDEATVAVGLGANKTHSNYLLTASNKPCHIKQIFALDKGKPSGLINIFPAVQSPYGLICHLQKALVCDDTQDAVLVMTAQDGTSIYAFDQLYAINAEHYRTHTAYYANFSAWAYEIQPSDQSQSVLVEDPKAIRYHRAFNDIVANNNGQIPTDIEAQIKVWQPDSEPLAPIEINLGHSCIYLFGETMGQQDEAWCQGQVLGKSEADFFGQALHLFDVVILRETAPFVVRIATKATKDSKNIQVGDYIQANIWLQVAIYPQKGG